MAKFKISRRIVGRRLDQPSERGVGFANVMAKQLDGPEIIECKRLRGILREHFVERSRCRFIPARLEIMGGAKQ